MDRAKRRELSYRQQRKRGKHRHHCCAAGIEPKTLNSEVLVIARGLEEVEWWSVYTPGRGTHLFDSYVPVQEFSVGREIRQQRYAGLEVPPDDTAGPRLRAPNVVAVLTYASAGRVIREVLVTSENRDTASLLRSYADSMRRVLVEQRPQGTELSVIWSSPEGAVPHSVRLPIVNDEPDLPHAAVSGGLRLAAWKR